MTILDLFLTVLGLLLIYSFIYGWIMFYKDEISNILFNGTILQFTIIFLWALSNLVYIILFIVFTPWTYKLF